MCVCMVYLVHFSMHHLLFNGIVTIIQWTITYQIFINELLLKEIFISMPTHMQMCVCVCVYSEQRSLLEKCAATALSSKLIARQKEFFSKMVVDAVLLLDELLPLSMIGMKKVKGGSLEVKDSAEEMYLCFIKCRTLV